MWQWSSEGSIALTGGLHGTSYLNGNLQYVVMRLTQKYSGHQENLEHSFETLLPLVGEGGGGVLLIFTEFR